MSIVSYHGVRTVNGCRVTVREPNRASRKLPMRLDLFNHSPTGFEWGYEGSGPAQLALALLAHALGDDNRAVRLHQRFKRRVIGRPLQGKDQWEFLHSDIVRLAAEIEVETHAS